MRRTEKLGGKSSPIRMTQRKRAIIKKGRLRLTGDKNNAGDNFTEFSVERTTIFKRRHPPAGTCFFLFLVGVRHDPLCRGGGVGSLRSPSVRQPISSLRSAINSDYTRYQVVISVKYAAASQPHSCNTCFVFCSKLSQERACERNYTN